ncbi:hypothetical protein TAESTU_30474 [Tenacibaculum aestuarii]
MYLDNGFFPKRKKVDYQRVIFLGKKQQEKLEKMKQSRPFKERLCQSSG